MTNDGNNRKMISRKMISVVCDTLCEKSVVERNGVWKGRFPLLMEWAQRLRPTVLCLQEFGFIKFEKDLLPES
jgi:hypothetical protein